MATTCIQDAYNSLCCDVVYFLERNRSTWIAFQRLAKHQQNVVYSHKLKFIQGLIVSQNRSIPIATQILSPSAIP